MRSILHSDLNNFYASVECLREPKIKEKAVIVCGDSEDRHGIVLAKNQIAKNYGIKTGDVIWEAKVKCADLVEIKADFGLYLEYSKRVREIYEQYTDKVEAFGIDECWLDVTGSKLLFGEAKKIAETIRKRIKEEIGLTVSIGVSYNKIFAKLGSDIKKPDAVTVITPQNFKKIVWPLKAEELLYVGKATKEKLNKYNIYTIGDIAAQEVSFLTEKLGKWGEYLHTFALGLDETPVTSIGLEESVKSIGNSITHYKDITTEEEIKSVIFLLSESVSERLRESGLGRAKHIKLNARNSDLSQSEKQKAFKYPTKLGSEIYENAFELFQSLYDKDFSIRGLGVGVFDFTLDRDQLSLEYVANNCHKKEKLEESVDKIRKKYGRGIIQRAIVFKDVRLRKLNIKDEHVIHPENFFGK